MIVAIIQEYRNLGLDFGNVPFDNPRGVTGVIGTLARC